MSTATVRGTIRGTRHRATPAVAVGAVAVPAVALAIVTVLSVLGFGVLLPGEVRIYRRLASGNPDPDVISRIGMRNARLSGLQGLFRLAIVVVMVSLRWPAA